MEKRVTKKFSSVRYWRYVFTPLLFVALAFGLFMLYASDVKLPSKPIFSETNAKSSMSFSSVLNSLSKLTKESS